MADINIQEVINHINIETANGYKLEFNGPVVNMNVVLSNYYTKTETDALLNDKADKADTYTKSETNILLNGKADKADTYTMSQINGIVHNIYTAVDTKQNLITGAASTITNSNLTKNRAVISNASGKVAVSNVTSTELEYLSGVTSGVQTQLNNKASTSLDNLSSDGQMIVDSQNGTISNCILDIPQNIKLELNNNVLTLKAGSIITLTGSSTYTTVTVASDRTKDFSSYSDGDIVVFANSVGGLGSDGLLNRIGSGNTLPSDSNTYVWYYLTTDYSIYHWENSSWTKKTITYPLCILHKSENNVSFAKDSNGNDMIFNGAGFIGHHAFVYPNVSSILAYEFNSDGSLKNETSTMTSLAIVEMTTGTYRAVCMAPSGTVYNTRFINVKNYSDLEQIQFLYQYCEKYNTTYAWNGSSFVVNRRCPIVKYDYDGTTVTDFTIRQPVRTATVEMLNSALGDVETLLAAI